MSTENLKIKKTRLLLHVCLVLALAFSLLLSSLFINSPMQEQDINVYADESGSIDGIDWEYDGTNHVLTILDGGTLPAPTTTASIFKVVADNNLKEIVITQDLVANANSSYLFCAFVQVVSITGIEKIDTSNVTDMNHMFSHNNYIASLDISNWDTSNVVDMNNMFYGCVRMTDFQIDSWDVSNVRDMSMMFYNCASLTEITLNNWNTSSLEDIHSMFSQCIRLSNLQIGEWDTSKVTDMSTLFMSCASLSAIQIDNWNTSNVTSMVFLFYGCKSLTNAPVENWDVSKVETMSTMFFDCINLTYIPVEKWNTRNVRQMNMMFFNCEKLTNIPVDNWQTDNVEEMRLMFNKCKELVNIPLDNWNVSSLKVMRQMFSECAKLATLNLENWVAPVLEDIEATFTGCSSLTGLNLSGWNTTAATGGYAKRALFNAVPLTKLVLGPNTLLGEKVSLSSINISDSKNTGNWIRIKDGSGSYMANDADYNTYPNSDAFMAEYDGSKSGTYVWERNLSAEFKIDGQVVSTQNVTTAKKLTPPNLPVKEGLYFAGWEYDTNANALTINTSSLSDGKITPLAQAKWNFAVDRAFDDIGMNATFSTNPADAVNADGSKVLSAKTGEDLQMGVVGLALLSLMLVLLYFIREKLY